MNFQKKKQQNSDKMTESWLPNYFQTLGIQEIQIIVSHPSIQRTPKIQNQKTLLEFGEDGRKS